MKACSSAAGVAARASRKNPLADRRLRTTHLRDAVHEFIEGMRARGYKDDEIADALARASSR